ncbi:MAG: UPF0280 family protein [Desulfovibrionaceae bacterium]
MPLAPHNDCDRAYRRACVPRPGEVAFQVVVEQTDLWITAERDLSGAALDVVNRLRGELKAYMLLAPAFGYSLAPVPVPPTAPEIARDMAAAGAACHVGPMAAVAGAVAERVAHALAPSSPNVLVENGGDLFLCSTRERVIGLLPDPAQEVVLGLRLGPRDFPCSVCASSAVIGHSLSLGQGDLVVVRGASGAYADAAATALCNIVKGKKDLNKVLARAKELAAAAPKGAIAGVLAQCGGELAVWGDMELAVV